MRYYRALIVALLALCLGVLTACSSGPAVATDAVSRAKLTYDEVVGTGLANKCPEISSFTRSSIPIDPKQEYILSELCLEPQEFFVKVEPKNTRQEAEFVAGKLLTRYTSTLDQVSGPLTLNSDGSFTFKETDGIDFQPITVQLPGGEEIPFFFTIKSLVAKSGSGFDSINSSVDFEGSFKVPSYRGAGFLDPKGRGITTGYDNAVALPAGADAEDLTRANVKQFITGTGEMSLQVTKVSGETGEVSGIFESIQPSATDLGAKDPEDVKVRGVFYGRVKPSV